MPLVTFVSTRGAPGATSTALAVAAAWPTSGERRKILLEADPAGGVLALRLGLAEDPGLVSLAAAARRGLGRADLWDHAQAVPGGLPVIPGPSAVAVASQLLANSADGIGRWIADLGDVDVIADAGRLSPTSESAPLVRASRLVVMVANPVADQLHQAAPQLSAVRSRETGAGWCLVGDGPYDPSAVEDAYGLPVIATIPDDPRGASMLYSGTPAKKLGRAPLIRAAADLADRVAPWLRRVMDSGGQAESTGQLDVAGGAATGVEGAIA